MKKGMPWKETRGKGKDLEERPFTSYKKIREVFDTRKKKGGQKKKKTEQAGVCCAGG